MGSSAPTVREHLDALDHAGLLSRGAPDDDLPPRLTHAGRQYLAAKGTGIRDDALSFLPHHIDDIHARDALLTGGAEIVDEFRETLLDGAGVTYAETLVPPAFEAVVDDKLALNLFAAAVALNARLTVEEPAACVGEELIAVAMIRRAKWLLSARARADAADDPLTREEAVEAKAHLNGVFELFQDDDVLNLFEMDEPADARSTATRGSAAKWELSTNALKPGFARSAGRPPPATWSRQRHATRRTTPDNHDGRHRRGGSSGLWAPQSIRG